MDVYALEKAGSNELLDAFPEFFDDGIYVLSVVRFSEEAGEAIEDMDAFIPHEGKEQFAVRDLFFPFEFPQRAELCYKEGQAVTLADGIAGVCQVFCLVRERLLQARAFCLHVFQGGF